MLSDAGTIVDKSRLNGAEGTRQGTMRTGRDFLSLQQSKKKVGKVSIKQRKYETMVLTKLSTVSIAK